MGSIKMNEIPERIIENPAKRGGVLRMSQIPDVGSMTVKKILYELNRKVGDVFKPDQWKGERCFVIGGGPSVNDFDIKALEGEHTIAVNMAFRLLKPEIVYATDARLWGWVERNETGANDKEEFEACGAIKVWSDLNNIPLPEDIVLAPAVAGGKISTSLNDGVAAGTNSGFGALNLAMLLGAKEIYLIGFDFYGGRWHAGYPEPSDAGNAFHLQCYQENEAEFKEWMKKTGNKIIQLNPESKLNFFEVGKMPEDLKPKRTRTIKDETPKVKRTKAESEPLFVTYFTPDNGYKELAVKLSKSLDRLDIEHSIQPVKNRGNWDANTRMKPDFILKMLDANPGRDIVWIDADALVVSVPEKILKCEADFACRIREDGELISSVMFFKNNANARTLLTEAATLIKKGNIQDCGEQRFIQEAFETVSKRPGFKFENLPEEYCWIVGISNPELVPVIEQHQASRRLK